MNNKNQYREEIEWSNTWVSRANQDCKRCLLIGDSTTRDIRSRLEKMTRNFMAIDLFAASYALTDEWFWESLNCFFQIIDYKYNVIVIHYGFHHGFEMNCYENESDYDTYMKLYQKLIKSIKKYSSNLIVMTGTTEHLKDDVNNVWIERELEIKARNEIAKKAAQENKIRILDLFQIMQTEGKTYLHRDVQHLEPKANAFIAYKLLDSMIKEYKCFQQETGAIKEMVNDKFDGREIMIYGSGNIGICTYGALICLGMADRIKCFLETHPQKEECCRISVRGIESISENEKNDVYVLIAAKDIENMSNYLAHFGYKNWCTYLQIFELVDRETHL